MRRGRFPDDPNQWPAKDGSVAVVLIVTIVVIALAGVAFRDVTVPRLAIFSPIALFAAVLGYVATAVVLLQTWRFSTSRRATLVLAMSFATNGILTFLALIALPVLPASPPLVNASSQAGIWLYVCWHVSAACGGFAYAFLRRRDDSRAVSRRFVVVSIASSACCLLAGAILAFVVSSHLPILSFDTSLAGLVDSGVGPVTAILLVGATLVVFRFGGRSTIDRSLAVSLFALTLEMLLLLTGERRFVVSFYAGNILLMLGASFVFVSAVQALVVSRTRLMEVESTLSELERDTAKRVTRIRALWQIAYDREPSEDSRFRQMLIVAAESIRPGKAVLGSLTHLEGDRVVVDASSHSAADWSSLGLAELGTPGAAFACEGSMHRLLADAGNARAWDDLTLLEGDAARTGEFGWRSFIGAPMIVARRTYFVIFASPDVMTEEPFAEDDIAYVEVVASFFASRFTQQVQFEQIQFEIEHDALTGLENRVQFRQAVRDEIAAGRPLAIAFVNLDGFRHVNERDGHHVGDEVLVEVARALKSVSHDDLLVRMSADEFGIVLRGVVSADAAADAVERYSQLFLLPFSVGTHGGTRVLSVRASIGAARFPQDGATVEELMRRASVALDVAKNRGGSTTVIFDLPMEAILEESHVRFMELSEAIALDQLALVYQPTFSLQTRAIVGAEALVRWDHPVRGRLLPSEFVGFAERNGLIGPLSRWVFERVARDISQAGALPNGFRIYLNLATHMLDDVPFISKIHELLRATPGLARHLGIEVTETAAMQNVERSLYSIELFRRWGISVAIDDFGTGYSSLSYLKQLTVDVVKIDRSFIAGLPGDERDCALTEMLLRITDQFGFVALAEGIETEAQAAWLLEHHCSLGQGYLVARPDSFDELLARVGVRSLAYEMEKR